MLADGEASETQYWLIVSGIANFRASRDLGFTVQGLKSRHRKKAERMGPGDRLIYYVTGLKAIGGIGTVTSSSFESHDRIWSSADPKKDLEDYPFRVNIEADLILDEGSFIPAEPLANAMEYTKRWPAKNWTLAFQGNVHNLPLGDYELIRAAVEQASDPDEPAVHDDSTPTGRSRDDLSQRAAMGAPGVHLSPHGQDNRSEREIHQSGDQW